MESRVLKGEFVPDQGFQFDTLLAGARRARELAQKEFKLAVKKSRSELARVMWRLRTRSRAHSRRMLEKAERTLCANHTVQSQRLHQEVVKSAYQDCLDIALRISREMVGEIYTRDADILAIRIQEALQYLSEAEVMRIEVATETAPALKAALSRLGLKVFVTAKWQVPQGSAIIISKSGSIEVAWQDDFEELASTIRAAFERRQAQEKNGESL